MIGKHCGEGMCVISTLTEQLTKTEEERLAVSRHPVAFK